MSNLILSAVTPNVPTVSRIIRDVPLARIRTDMAKVLREARGNRHRIVTNATGLSWQILIGATTVCAEIDIHEPELICPDGCGPCAHGEVSCLCLEDHPEPTLNGGESQPCLCDMAEAPHDHIDPDETLPALSTLSDSELDAVLKPLEWDGSQVKPAALLLAALTLVVALAGCDRAHDPTAPQYAPTPIPGSLFTACPSGYTYDIQSRSCVTPPLCPSGEAFELYVGCVAPIPPTPTPGPRP